MSLIYLLIFWSLLISTAYEFFKDKVLSEKWYYSIVVTMILTASLSYAVSPDWLAYLKAFRQLGDVDWLYIKAYGDYTGMEHGYLYLNKLIYSLGFDFGMVSIVVVSISLFLKAITIHKYGGYVFLALFMYMGSTYLFEEHVHIRQGLANAISFYSIRYILDKKLWKFLLCIVIAYQFHESVIVFVLAYWIANVKVGPLFIGWIVCLTIVGSFAGMNVVIDGIMNFMPFGQDKFEAYESALYATGDIAVGDFVKVGTILVIVLFDKYASHDRYYCAFRNLFVTGVLLYFFLGKGIFGIRLPNYYLVFIGLVASRMVYVFSGKRALKSLVFTSFWTYTMLLFFWFQIKQAHKSNFGDYKTIFNSSSIYGIWR